tara:strand:- start:4701 stop:5336 length:636 start_codon:yes stop_codon:yes gene_type:complete
MRKYQYKPGIDWQEIEARVRSGEPLLRVSKDYDISRQAIIKRSRKEGWLDSNKKIRLAKKVVTGVTKEKSVTLKSVAKPFSKYIQKHAKDKPETIDSILGLLRSGNPRKIAVQASGVSMDSFLRWVREDMSFADNVRKAESMAVADRLQNISAAGKRGDWKADTWVLERTHKDIFGEKESKNNNLAVQININRGDKEEIVDIHTTDTKSVD